MDKDWQEKARLRIKELHLLGDDMALWETLRNPANKVSRKELQELDPAAPDYDAPIKDWEAYIAGRFPAFRDKVRARHEQHARESATRAETHKNNQNETIARMGPSWNYGGTIHANALTFIRHLLSQGFKPEKTGIGAIRMINAEGIFIGPLRNRHINAALAFLSAVEVQHASN